MEIKNFAILQGNSATLDDGKIVYKFAKSTEKDAQKNNDKGKNEPENVIIRSDSTFGNGSLEFCIKTDSHNTGVIASFTSFDNREVRCGYSRTWKQFLIAISEANDWKPLSTAGKLSNYDLNAEIKFRIEINGSQINLFVNNIILCSANIPVKETPLEIDLWSDGKLELFKIQKHSTKPKIFVVMQFSKEYNELFEEVIRPVTEKFGYECIRADEYYTGTPILTDIIKSIQDSTAIIAEITPDNPNVFYEIGYSHAIGKPTILLCDKKREKLPFDLSGFRTLFYENSIAGKKKVENSLMKYLENI